MNDNVRKVFEILGVEPYEEFKLESDATNTIYYITEDLNFIGINESVKNNFDDCFRLLLTNKIGNIVKLSKELKKKKLRDITPEEWDKWVRRNCTYPCEGCIFRNVICSNYTHQESWIHHKDLYSNEFLDQEIEVEE